MWKVEREHPQVATLWLARPQAKNALSLAALAALPAICDTLAADRSVHVLLIRAKGDVFCAGGDLFDLHDSLSEEGAVRLAETGSRALTALEELPFPTLAVIAGAAIGGGAELTLAADFRLMAESATLEFRHAALGVTTAWGSLPRLVALVGSARATQLLMQSTRFTSAELLGHGLATSVHAANKLDEAATTLATHLASLSPASLRETKANLRAFRDTAEHAQALARERASFVRTWPSDEHRARVLPFLNRNRRSK